MPMTLDQIVEEASHLPREQVAEVVDRLTSGLHTDVEPGIESAWKQETRRRLAELESGEVQAVPGDMVSSVSVKLSGGETARLPSRSGGGIRGCCKLLHADLSQKIS